jgi:trigger factor
MVIHLELGEKKDPEGILKQLIGISPPQKREVAFPDGRTLTVEVKGIKEKELPALDDPFAQSIGPFGAGGEVPKTLEELKGAIRNELQAQAAVSQRQILEGQAAHQLLGGWDFDVPPSLVGSQARRILKGRAVELMNQGVLPDQVEGQVQALTDQAKLDALRRVKLFFILRRIAAAEGISATAEEVQAKVQHLANRLGWPLEEARRELESRGLLEELIWSVVRHKVTDLVIREAELKEGGADAGA